MSTFAEQRLMPDSMTFFGDCDLDPAKKDLGDKTIGKQFSAKILPLKSYNRLLYVMETCARPLEQYSTKLELSNITFSQYKITSRTIGNNISIYFEHKLPAAPVAV